MSSHFVFGPFTLDPVGAELRRDDEPIPLRPKCYDLLLFFLQNRGRLISAEELLREIWDDVVVSEGTINRTVSALRAALHDEAEHPAYIDTVPRRGYRFIAAVVAAESTGSDASGHDAHFALVHKAQHSPLHEGEHVIGRGDDVDIPLFGPLISRHHARVRVAGMTVTVEDLGSRNGTFVNGTRAAGIVTLRTGDEICIGTERLVLWARHATTASAGE